MSNHTPEFAMVFPGQGSQAVGMMAAWQEDETVRETFGEASEPLGYDLWELIANGPAEELDRTDRTQPAILVASVALWRVWQERGGAEPAVLAGHSLGEYSALVAAESLQLADAAALVAERGRYMQEAVPAGEGAMAAVIGLEDDKIREICAGAAQGAVVQPVNFNAPGQVVIAGNQEAVERAGSAAKEAGAKRVLPLPVSAPSHCSLMQPAAERLAQRLEEVAIEEPRRPVIHNVDVSVSRDAASIRRRLVEQLANPVRWTETVQKMSGEGVQVLAECGPGKVLTGLTRRIERSLQGGSLSEPDTLDDMLRRFPATS
ncbi:MAG: ACP S-malonyltransferase [Halorhodospira halophila]|uniref:ACP S-malonyltransferase n=1 Tax=Halorhodospira TaxID=85108 RepID=UPI0019143ECC|nr:MULTISPECIES: ACP S-malonyltransferase [Halorhodospira]MBK5942314.1 [acyl-carrier-protein] S-malonyltransferase [Halorhodospira halophila]MCC3750345.1 ACP S-malonyltransferase [Halorhodospira halophila]MCG5528096.1 ACP S-malonyltransferase [Halorhodospira halophila]MCG5531865.1 ACP S-malonyltransferase [Halorhodospira sp. 9621]MCG5537513.1 ACP S-malonyltransferase [Halorhodospira sp. 9622]